MLLHASALSSLSEICPLLPSQDPPPQDPSNLILAHFSPLIPTLTCFLDGGLSSARHLRPACLSTAPLSFSPLFSAWVQVSFFIKTNKLGSHSVALADLEPSVILLLHTLTLGSSRLFCFQSTSLSSFLDLQKSLLSRAVFHSCAILVGGVLAQHQHGFDPQHQIKPGTVVLICNPSTQGRNSPASATQRVQRKPGKHKVLFQNKYIIK